MKKSYTLSILLSIILFSGCATQADYEDNDYRANECESELSDLKSKVRVAASYCENLQYEFDDKESEYNNLQSCIEDCIYYGDIDECEMCL